MVSRDRRLGFGLRLLGSLGLLEVGGLLGFRGERRWSVCGDYHSSVNDQKMEEKGEIPKNILWFAVFGVDESFGLGVAVH